MRPSLVIAGIGVLAGFFGSTSRAQDGALCEPLSRIVATAPREFSPLKSAEYSTKFESWQSRETLPGFDSCWIDDVQHRFWCLHQAPNIDAAMRLGAQTVDSVTGCYPVVRRRSATVTMDNDLTRTTTEWTLDETRRVLVVERRPSSGRGVASVFLYLY